MISPNFILGKEEGGGEGVKIGLLGMGEREREKVNESYKRAYYALENANFRLENARF